MKLLIGWLGRAISFILFHSPAWVRRALGSFLAFLWFDFFRIRRMVVLDNLATAFPEMDEAERVRLGRKSMQSLGLNFIEYSFLPWLNKSNYQRYFEFRN